MDQVFKLNEKEKDFFEAIIANFSEIWEFIAKEKAETKDTDFWSEFDDQTDIHFSECDDTDCPDFEKLEFFAYPIEKDSDGNPSTDTSFGLQIKPQGIYCFTSLDNFSVEQYADGKWFYEFQDVRSKMRYGSLKLAFRALQKSGS